MCANYTYFNMNDLQIRGCHDQMLNSHPRFPFCKRVSHFESDLQILYPAFHFCNDFPVFSFFLWYNRFMAGYFSAQKPDVSCDLQILLAIIHVFCCSYFSRRSVLYSVFRLLFEKSCGEVDVFGCNLAAS